MFYGDAGLDGLRDRLEIVEGDIRALPPGLLDGVYAIINLAGLSTERAAVGLVKLAKEKGIKRFVQASSGSIYDVGAGHPEKDIVYTEDSPVAPFRIYSITKREAEKEILGMADETFTPVVLRKGSVYGYSPRMRFDLVVLSALQTGRLLLHNGGEMWRPLLSVQDAAAAPPRGGIHRVIWAGVHCSPCYNPEEYIFGTRWHGKKLFKCWRSTHECMVAITAEEVYDAVVEQIRTFGKTSAGQETKERNVVHGC